MSDDMISRQEAIDALNVGAELLNRVLDDTDVAGVEREKYEWGLGLIKSCISDLKDLPSVQPEVLACGEGELNVPEWDEMIVICDCCGHAIHVKRQKGEQNEGS